MLFTRQALAWLEDILNERFGHRFALSETNEGLCITLPSHNGIIFFDTLQSIFHESRSDFQCGEWDGEAEGWKSVLGGRIPTPGKIDLHLPLIKPTESGYIVHYDILGLTYWMLSRLEEVDRTDLDSHGRFPATSSHAFKYGYLERPIVDEWLHVLGQVIKRVWPEVELTAHQYNIKVSHDVDIPSRYGFRNVTGMLRAMGNDLVFRKDFRGAIMAPWLWASTRTSLHPLDPANTFDWIMALSERHGVASAFYFICGRTDPDKDADYELEHPAIRKLMRAIHKRGHEIGIHPSYNSYQDSGVIGRENARLKRVCKSEGIEQKAWGGRMHFLRWKHPVTMRGWEEAGLTYDSTLGYADHPGFRCGTCFEYPAFDPVTSIQLKLRIRPLIAMECTVMASRYLGLGNGQAALDKFIELQSACRAVNGCFTLLWHNNHLSNRSDRLLYERLLSLVCAADILNSQLYAK